MNNTKAKTNVLRFSALAVLLGVGATTVGCNDRLFFTVNGKDMEVTFCDRGASIYSIKYKDQVVTYHPKDKGTFLRNDYYYGKALGRVAGRIPDGKLNVNGKDYQLEVNEKSATKNNSLHGGTHSFATKDFKRYVEETNDYIKVSFNYVSPSMEAGFPELVDSWFNYTVHKNESVIDLNIIATSTGTTPVDLTTHPYFRLGNEGDILSHTLEVPADNRAKYNDAGGQVVEGKLPVQGTPYDFRTAHKIGDKIEAAKADDPISGGYDHIWIFNENNRYVELKNPNTKIGLKVTTDADAVIMYANCYPHPNDEMNPSGKDSLYAGISIEPYKFFTKDTVSDIFITPEKPYTRSITYTFNSF